jgi:hypothetical protein
MPGQNPFCYMPGHIHPHLLTLSQLPLFSKLAVSAEGQGQGWVPGHALGGHYGAVVDMCWGVDGSCLLTASTDQTCRITVQNEGRWSELARPQARVTTYSDPHHHRHLKVCAVQYHVAPRDPNKSVQGILQACSVAQHACNLHQSIQFPCCIPMNVHA